MKIKDVEITNWTPPGEEFWADAATHPEEPKIEATIKIVVSHREYQQILDMGDRPRTPLWTPTLYS